MKNKIISEVKALGGVPTLFIKGEPTPASAYITYFTENNRYKAFAHAGYRLFSVTVYFAAQTINVCFNPKPFGRGIFDVKGKPDFSAADEYIYEILRECPDAMIFPRINMALPEWWELENPEECCDTSVKYAGKYEYSHTRPCFSSDKWLETTKDFLRQYIDHVNASDYLGHIVGYQLADGNTEEWFSYDQTGSLGVRSREKFAGYSGGGGDEYEYRKFLSRVVADRIAELAKFTKDYTGRRYIVGSFYGYTFETPFWESGHRALKRLLECGDIDFLCSPASYAETRRTGRDYSCMTVLDSLKYHGKLYFTENDIRTYLSGFMKDYRPDTPLPGTYEHDGWRGHATAWESRMALRACFARQLTHGNGAWWFDMWGGWYEDEGIMSDIKAELELLRQALRDPRRESVAELAVVIDEESSAYADGRPGYIHAITTANRDSLGNSGVPYDAYEISDFERIAEKYKCFLFMIPKMTDKMLSALDWCASHDRPYLTADETTPKRTADELRELAVSGGAHVWNETGDVIYACENFAAIHAASDGAKKIKLPRVRRVKRLLGEAEEFTSEVILADMKKSETLLFRLD